MYAYVHIVCMSIRISNVHFPHTIKMQRQKHLRVLVASVISMRDLIHAFSHNHIRARAGASPRRMSQKTRLCTMDVCMQVQHVHNVQCMHPDQVLIVRVCVCLCMCLSMQVHTDIPILRLHKCVAGLVASTHHMRDSPPTFFCGHI
jgi:hypothetical protein